MFIVCHPPGMLAEFRNALEAAINRSQREWTEADELADLRERQAALNEAISRYDVADEIPLLRRRIGEN